MRKLSAQAVGLAHRGQDLDARPEKSRSRPSPCIPRPAGRPSGRRGRVGLTTLNSFATTVVTPPKCSGPRCRGPLQDLGQAGDLDGGREPGGYISLLGGATGVHPLGLEPAPGRRLVARVGAEILAGAEQVRVEEQGPTTTSQALRAAHQRQVASRGGHRGRNSIVGTRPTESHHRAGSAKRLPPTQRCALASDPIAAIRDLQVAGRLAAELGPVGGRAQHEQALKLPASSSMPARSSSSAADSSSATRKFRGHARGRVVGRALVVGERERAQDNPDASPLARRRHLGLDQRSRRARRRGSCRRRGRSAAGGCKTSAPRRRGAVSGVAPLTWPTKRSGRIAAAVVSRACATAASGTHRSAIRRSRRRRRRRAVRRSFHIQSASTAARASLWPTRPRRSPRAARGARQGRSCGSGSRSSSRSGDTRRAVLWLVVVVVRVCWEVAAGRNYTPRAIRAAKPQIASGGKPSAVRERD